MEQSEIEQLVEEVETRVERLRSLYDQYFMGIERIEPQIAKKDVERRIQVLRRTQIRNTGLRYRFQNVLLRYNTFGSYWSRICRQIEDGTYKRDLRRAKARFDPQAQAKEARNARDARDEAARNAAVPDARDTEPPPFGAPSDSSGDLGVDVDFDDGLDAPDVRAALRSQSVPSVHGGVLASSFAAGNGARPQPSKVERGTHPAPPPLHSPPDARLPPSSKRNSSRRPPPLPPKAPPPRPPPLPPQKRPPAPPGTAPVAAASPPATSPQKPLPRPLPPPTNRPKPPDPSNLSDERVRQIYSKYVESRRSLKESTAGVTMDSLAKSLRDSSEKLRQKHVGKAVDFEVQVKDGKTVLKPIVK